MAAPLNLALNFLSFLFIDLDRKCIEDTRNLKRLMEKGWQRGSKAAFLWVMSNKSVYPWPQDSSFSLGREYS